jgi:hypothetical protein
MGALVHASQAKMSALIQCGFWIETRAMILDLQTGVFPADIQMNDCLTGPAVLGYIDQRFMCNGIETCGNCFG